MRIKRYAGIAVFIVALLATAIVWAQDLPRARPESVGMSTQRLGRITEVLKEEVTQDSFPGAVVLVARKGKLVYSDAIGFLDKNANVPMSKDAIFRIYSMTKPLVSVAAMMLVEDGKIQLTDPVSKFLPGFDKLQVSVPSAGGSSSTVVPQGRQMTVQDLLRHTSGLTYGEITKNQPVKEAYAKAGVYLPGVRDYDARGVTPSEEVLGIAEAPLANQPGTVWEYGLSTDILGRVVETASGKRLGDFLNERLFKPLKMVDTGFWVSKPNLKRLAQALPKDRTTGAPNLLIDVSEQPKNDSGGAGGVSTASDYLRFGQMLLNGGKLDNVRVMSRTTIALMTADQLSTRINQPLQPGELLLGTLGYTFGLGFLVRQGPGIAGVPGSAGEFMWAGAAGTFFWVDPKEELVGIYMTQAPSPIRAYYRKLFKQLVYQAITD